MMSSIVSLACPSADAAHDRGLHFPSNTLSEDSEPHSKGTNGPKLDVSTGSFAASSADSPNEKQQTKRWNDENEGEPRSSSPTCRLTRVDGVEFEILNSRSACTEFESQSSQSFIDKDGDDEDGGDSDSASYISLLEEFSLSGDSGRIMWVDGMKFEMVSVPFPARRPTTTLQSMRSEYLSSNTDYLEQRARDVNVPVSRQDDTCQVLNVPWAEYASPDIFTGYLWPPTSERDYIPTLPSPFEIEDYRNAFDALFESSESPLEADDTARGGAPVTL